MSLLILLLILILLLLLLFLIFIVDFTFSLVFSVLLWPFTVPSYCAVLVVGHFAVEKCADKLGVTEADIIYSVSYGGANVDRTFEYDKLIFHNLEKLQTVATEYAKSLEELYPEDGISNEAFATMRIFQNEFN